MKHSFFVIGNSSSGIIESTAVNTPAVNIGNRQKGREKGCNVIDIETVDHSLKTKIQRLFIEDAYYQSFKDKKSPYGDGKTVERIISLIKSLEPSKLDRTTFIHDNKDILNTIISDVNQNYLGKSMSEIFQLER